VAAGGAPRPGWSHPRRYPTAVLLLALGGVSVVFAWLTVDLLTLAMANIDFLRRHGAMAVMEGGLVQFGLNVAKGFAALLAYLAFRGIEAEIMRRWIGRD
jgi:hypothetical protein